ncbi:MAG: LLM class flavin-dependent oxidoreductase, partial [Anaerolineales bacterium]|nr:LLM class flavin-dependent oxidoreductase [Anaerolineales bacterium]
VYRLLRSDERVSYEGDYYRLQDAQLLPPPAGQGRPLISIGGTGWNRTLPLAARFADDWNAVLVDPEDFARHDRRLTELIESEGREAGEVRRSLMTGVVFGRDQDELEDKAAERGRSLDELRGGSAIVGTPQEVIDRIGEYADAGLERIMLQWLDTDDLDRLRALADAVIPAFHRD